MAGPCEHGDAPSCSIKFVKFNSFSEGICSVELFTRIEKSQTSVLLQQTKFGPDLPSAYLFATEQSFKISHIEIGLSPVLTRPFDISLVPSTLCPKNVVLFAERPVLMARRGNSSSRLAFRFALCSHCTHVIPSTQRYLYLKILFLHLRFMLH